MEQNQSASIEQASEQNVPETQSNEGNPTQVSEEAGGQKEQSLKPPGDDQEYEVVINGKTHKMNLRELKNHASMAYAAQSRFEEAARLRKEMEQFKSTAQKDIIQALYAQGFTDDQIRDHMEKWYTQKFIEPETLSPEERKIKEYEAELERYRTEQREKEDAEKKKYQDEIVQQQREYLENQIIQALENSGLPKTRYIASRMAFYMKQNLEKGWEAPMDLIVEQVKNERKLLQNAEVSELDGEALVKYLGEDIIHKIRRYDLEQLRSRKQNALSEFPSSNEPIDRSQKLHSTEVTRRLKEMRLGKR
jgi:hypothetical protein